MVLRCIEELGLTSSEADEWSRVELLCRQPPTPLQLKALFIAAIKWDRDPRLKHVALDLLNDSMDEEVLMMCKSILSDWEIPRDYRL